MGVDIYIETKKDGSPFFPDKRGMSDKRFKKLTKKEQSDYCKKQWDDWNAERERRCIALGIPDKSEDPSHKSYDAYHGRWGYLRGGYFGGMADVLRFLFDWVDWNKNKPVPFDADKFEERLNALRVKGKRPGRTPTRLEKSVGKAFMGMAGRDISDSCDTEGMKVPAWAYTEYEDFLAFGRKLIAEGKAPMVNISW